MDAIYDRFESMGDEGRGDNSKCAEWGPWKIILMIIDSKDYLYV